MLIKGQENVHSISTDAKVAIAKKSNSDALRKRLIPEAGIVSSISSSGNTKRIPKFDIYISGEDGYSLGVNSTLTQDELSIITPLVTLVELDVADELNLFTYNGTGGGAHHCKTLQDAAKEIIVQRKGILKEDLSSGSTLVISPATGGKIVKVSDVLFLEANAVELTNALEELTT